MLPSSFLAVAAFTYMSSKMSRSKLFNLIISSFATFFIGFAFFLYPFRNLLIPTAFADSAGTVLPSGLMPAAAVVRNWMYALFYVCSELWGDVVLAFLFWGLANEITQLDEAPQLYPLFGIGANIAQVFAGRILKTIGQFLPTWELQLKALCTLCATSAMLIVGVHDVIQRKASHNDWGVQHNEATSNDAAARASGRSDAEDVESEAPKPTFWEAVRGVTQSAEVRCLAIMAAAQGLASNVFQVAWKGQLRLVCPDPAQYSAFMGDVATCCGLTTIASMMIAPQLFNRLGWAGAASVSPRAMLGLGSIFFGGTIVTQWFGQGHPPAKLLLPMVIVGAALFVLERAGKFSFFKPAEEMVYISLSREERTKGKAAVDIMGMQVGKAGGSVLLQCLLLVVATVQRALPILWISHLTMVVIWLSAIRTIDSRSGSKFASPNGRNHVNISPAAKEGNGAALDHPSAAADNVAEEGTRDRDGSSASEANR